MIDDIILVSNAVFSGSASSVHGDEMEVVRRTPRVFQYSERTVIAHEKPKSPMLLVTET